MADLDLDAIKFILASYDEADDTDAQDGLANELVLHGLTETEARKEWDETAQWLAWTGTRRARAAAAQREEP